MVMSNDEKIASADNVYVLFYLEIDRLVWCYHSTYGDYTDALNARYEFNAKERNSRPVGTRTFEVFLFSTQGAIPGKMIHLDP
jgi:hypothetical protein